MCVTRTCLKVELQSLNRRKMTMWKTMGQELATGLILAAVVAVGFTWHHYATKDNKDAEAKSQLEVLIRKMDKANQDGQPISTEGMEQNDPWGRPIICEYTKEEKRNVLELRSAGRDGLPYTKDDIVVTKVYPKAGKPFHKLMEENAESLMRGLTRGGVGGAREGMREKGDTAPQK
jgi:hypothetical protein